MIWMWTAFSLGLFGSLHCAGMCGPIAMALPLSMKEKTSILAQSLIYNFGRIASYMLMGLVMGLLGWGALVAGYQKYLSVGIVSTILRIDLEIARSFFNIARSFVTGCGSNDKLISLNDLDTLFIAIRTRL